MHFITTYVLQYCATGYGFWSLSWTDQANLSAELFPNTLLHYLIIPYSNFVLLRMALSYRTAFLSTVIS